MPLMCIVGPPERTTSQGISLSVDTIKQVLLEKSIRELSSRSICPKCVVMLIRCLVFIVCLAGSAMIGAQEAPGKRPVRAPKASKPEPQGICLVAEFRNLALTMHDPKQRQEAVITWLKNHTQTCSVAQLNVINNYRALWLGTSDSPQVAGIIDSLIELKADGDPQKLQDLFGPQVTTAIKSDAVVATASPVQSNSVYQMLSPPPMQPNYGADPAMAPVVGNWSNPMLQPPQASAFTR